MKVISTPETIVRFPLPPPNPRSNRRFSSTPSYHYGPRTPQALDAAIRYAANFSYDDPPLHTLTPLPLCNSRTRPLGLGTSDAQLQNPLLLLHRMSNAGYSQAPFDCTPSLSILLISLPSLKAISLATSAWINLSRSCPPILLILRPCRPPFSNLEPLEPKVEVAQIPRQPLHVVPLPLQLPLIPRHHMLPNHLLHSLTLQLSRSLLLILPTLPLPTLSPLPFPLSLILRS